MPITDKQQGYAQQVYQHLFDAGFRVSLDDRSEKIGYKIREAQVQKIPYMLIIGEKEAEAQRLAIAAEKVQEARAMEEAYKEIEKSLPEEYQGKVDNPDQ